MLNSHSNRLEIARIEFTSFTLGRNMYHNLARILLLSLTLGVAARPVAAQVLYGSVIGTVSDPSGAVVPGATVTLTSKLTGLDRTDKSDECGRYSFVNVLPAQYDV